MARHKGLKLATRATASKPAIVACRMLMWGRDYVSEAREERDRKRTLSYVKRTAKELGYVVLPKAATPEAIPTSPG